MATDNFDKIEKVAKIGEPDKTEVEREIEPQQRKVPNKEQFNALMKEDNRALALTTPSDSKTSLMEAVRDLNYTEPKNRTQITHDTIINQTKEAVQQIEQIKHTLESPNISIKGGAQQLLQNKLSHIDESLRIALSKTGVEAIPNEAATKTPPSVNPIERFLSYLTDGQYQLQNLGHELHVMAQNEKELSPVNMLAVQVKVTQIQQELELFSSLLNKALESIKTVMNIQV